MPQVWQQLPGRKAAGRGQAALPQDARQPMPQRRRTHGQHTQRHALAMEELPSRTAFNGVADGVPEIQYAAQPLLRGVLLHHPRLDGQRAGDDLRQIRRQVGAVLDQRQQRRIAGHGHLHTLGQSRGHLPRRQRTEGIRVDQHGTGLVERTHDVLHAVHVDGGLAADRGVHLGQQCGGQVVEIHAPHVGGGGEARQIPRHAAAHGGHAVAAIHAQGQHLPQEALVIVHIFAVLSGGEGADAGLTARARHRPGVLLRHAAVSHHQYPPRQRQVLPRPGQCACLQQDGIALRSQ